MIKRISVFMMVMIICIGVTGCQNKPKSAFGFNDKVYAEEREDGWVYVSTYEYPKDDSPTQNHREISYGYDAYNLKYKHIDGYDLRIYDKDTGKLIGSSTTVMPYLSLLPKAEIDVKRITDYFNERKFATTITKDDLSGLSLGYLDKDDALKLYNKTIVQNPQPEGKYTLIPSANMIQSIEIDDCKWQAGYIICHGNIIAFRIELIYKGEIHLSDLVKQKKANEEQKEIYEKYKEIEKNVLQSNSFVKSNIDESLEIGKVNFSMLSEVLNKLESGEQ